jgi:hypothetical protein
MDEPIPSVTTPRVRGAAWGVCNASALSSLQLLTDAPDAKRMLRARSLFQLTSGTTS